MHLISVALLGHPDADIATKLAGLASSDPGQRGFAANALNDDGDLHRMLVQCRPHVIFTFGESTRFPNLFASSIDVRRRWVHFDTTPTVEELAQRALVVFVDVATNNRFPDEPLVSVFTPSYCTVDLIRRPYESLLAQTYSNWEWVVYDDSPNDETFLLLRDIAAHDARVRIFRGDGNWGAIGEVKRRLCGLARGSILVELDHDDELTSGCLGGVVEAFARFPDAGFAYTDCAEVFDDGEPAGYPEGWAFGFGSYRKERYRDCDYLVANFPSVNAKTIRHIVAVPNHARAWRRDVYNAIGGHNAEVHVADDYEIILRTFLHTRMVHIQRFGYIQYLRRDGGNTQRQRVHEIQRLVALFQQRYDDEIHARLVELGVEDFIWQGPGHLDWSIENPTDTPFANLCMP